jgi:hypothetical protein
MSAMSNDQASIASGQGPRTPFPADTTFSSVNFEEQVKEMRRQVNSQADAFLEWSKEWTTEKCDVIGCDLRFLLSESNHSVLGKEKTDSIQSRVDDMLWALRVAQGEVEPNSDVGVIDEDQA